MSSFAADSVKGSGRDGACIQIELAITSDTSRVDSQCPIILESRKECYVVGMISAVGVDDFEDFKVRQKEVSHAITKCVWSRGAASDDKRVVPVPPVMLSVPFKVKFVPFSVFVPLA